VGDEMRDQCVLKCYGFIKCSWYVDFLGSVISSVSLVVLLFGIGLCLLCVCVRMWLSVQDWDELLWC
jgi:hypothetical protein